MAAQIASEDFPSIPAIANGMSSIYSLASNDTRLSIGSIIEMMSAIQVYQ